MALFGKREKAYEVWGDKPRWKEARQRLKDAGIKVMETGFYETEAPACGCGAKLDQRDFGPNGKIDRLTYYIPVKPEDGERAKELGADMSCGMGGGKALDTAKGAAERAGLPVCTCPTIAATCAATTALSVVYREDGNFDSFYFYDKPARHCFINTRVIADAPWEYLRAGMGDTMGKFFECHFAARGDSLDHSSALGREISNLCYGPLLEHGVQALADCKRH